MRWLNTLRYAEEAGASDRDPSTEETVINMPRQDFTGLLNGPPSEDEHELAEHVKQRQIALAVAYAAAARAR